MKSLIKIFLATFLLVHFSLTIISQPGSAPPPPSGHGSNGNQGGGNAPLGEGIAFLTALSIAYGIRKIRNTKKIKRDQADNT